MCNSLFLSPLTDQMLQLTINEKNTYSVEINDEVTLLDGYTVSPDISRLDDGLLSIIYNNRSYTAIVEEIDQQNKSITLNIDGQIYKTAITEPIDVLLSTMGIDAKLTKKSEPVKAPMPGMVLKILVVPGQQVEKGEALMILEAMKMENILKATTSCTIKSVKVAEKTAVEKGAILLELE
jgi:biotin carboxyl carrier protein